jgi:hypothetical protein
MNGNRMNQQSINRAGRLSEVNQKSKIALWLRK